MFVPGHQTNSVITIIQQLLRSCEALRYLIQICTVIVIRAFFCVLAVELLKYHNSHFFCHSHSRPYFHNGFAIVKLLHGSKSSTLSFFPQALSVARGHLADDDATAVLSLGVAD